MSSPSKRRDMDVMKLMMNDYTVETKDDEINNFVVEFHGPKESLYEGGVWKVRVELPDAYPYKSPSIGFINKIYHPNVDELSGSVCLDVINQTWSPMFDLLNIFEVFLPQLLLYPNPSDPLNGDAASLMMKDKKQYDQKVKGRNEKCTMVFPCDARVDRATQVGKRELSVWHGQELFQLPNSHSIKLLPNHEAALRGVNSLTRDLLIFGQECLQIGNRSELSIGEDNEVILISQVGDRDAVSATVESTQRTRSFSKLISAEEASSSASFTRGWNIPFRRLCDRFTSQMVVTQFPARITDKRGVFIETLEEEISISMFDMNALVESPGNVKFHTNPNILGSGEVERSIVNL
ncbi:unnamed protein product [Cuscuta campestris]|uniref:E2 ubiquitin-conjugating enzyme n=1 Tax=Cuscuta campestris TaxID=132261 RepID=A0A484LB34_9ASTE|nr:unnamed protein product [Cuscuta campestris]